jgi:hypothetical protein
MTCLNYVTSNDWILSIVCMQVVYRVVVTIFSNLSTTWLLVNVCMEEILPYPWQFDH